VRKLENEEKIAKKRDLFKDLFLLEEAIQVLQRRRGEFFNFSGGCRELIDEERKVIQELTDISEEEPPKKGEIK